MRFIVILLSLPFLSCSNTGSQLNSAIVSKTDTVPKAGFRLLEFMMDDKPCLAMIDVKYKDFGQKGEFPLSFFIAVTTVDKDKNGHPTDKEALVFNGIEDQLLKELSPLGICYIGRTTMTGYRDLLFYIKTSDQKKAAEKLGQLQKKLPRIKSFTFENDPKWEAVEEFYRAMKN